MRIFFIIILLIYPYYLNSKVINLKYEIDWQSIHLADLNWIIKLEESKYEINFIIKSFGLTDKIYNYESVTNITGNIENNHLRPEKYISKTKSTKQDRYENIFFSKNGLITKLDISKELSSDQIELQNNRITEHQYFTDPISQLTQYILYNKDSDRIIIDGLNIYELLKSSKENDILQKNNPSIYSGEVSLLDLTFPFFKGLFKENKKNNLKLIRMTYYDNELNNIPVIFEIKSRKFDANLYLKDYNVIE